MNKKDFEKVKAYYDELKPYREDNENKKEQDSHFFHCFIEMIDEFWKVRKTLICGDKIIGILMYHDCLSATVHKRQACYYLEGKYDKYKNRKDVFPDWEEFMQECREDKEKDTPIVEDTLKVFDTFFENDLDYFPCFYGYYGKTYLKLVLNEEKSDYILDLDFLDKETNIKELNEELYQHIKNNPLDFVDELRNW